MTEAKQKAYVEGIQSGYFNNNAQRVYNLLKYKDMTTEAIYKVLGKQRNELSGRISDLLDSGLIKELSAGRYSLLSITPIDEIPYYRAKRTYNKYLKWKKQGEKFKRFEVKGF